MSAKPSEPKPTDPVDTVTDKLANLGASASEADLAAAKKAEKKARQKAKKDAENKDSKETKPVKEENGSGEGGKAKKSNKNKNKTKTPKTQTDPPTVPISVLFSGKDYPEGQIMDHPIGNDDAKAKQRFTSEEARALDRAQLDMYNEIR